MTSVSNMYDAEAIPQAAMEEIERLFKTGDLFRYTAESGSPATLLEDEFAAMLGAKYALAVSSCSAALFLSLKALDLPRGARVLIPAFTFAAVPSSIVHADCVPVLCEIKDNYRIDMDHFREMLSQDISAVMISHMRGHTSDMDGIVEACTEANIPVIEDAAHSLGTTWDGENIGTIGQIGCFSFQSYKMVNAGEGGIMISNDPDLIARAVIMSGAYEHNWKKHSIPHDVFAKWQNKLPLYNLRISNLSAAIARSQLPELARRVRDGRRNHDFVAGELNTSAHVNVPDPLEKELRAPDSIQFNLIDMDDSEVDAFVKHAASEGVKIQVFGKSTDNARAFWNWGFIGEIPNLPKTKEILMRACDVRLPARLQMDELKLIAEIILRSVNRAKQSL